MVGDGEEYGKYVELQPPGSPRRKKGGRSYHDLTTVREAAAADANSRMGTMGEGRSPRVNGGDLPRVDDEHVGLVLRKGVKKPDETREG